jgi:hypothetical protein
MTVAKIFGAFLMTLILGMSFGAIDTAEAKKDRGTPGHKTFKCPGPAHWRLPRHVSTVVQKSGSSCIKKGTKKADGVGYYKQCEAKKKCGMDVDCMYVEAKKDSSNAAWTATSCK